MYFMFTMRTHKRPDTALLKLIRVFVKRKINCNVMKGNLLSLKVQGINTVISCTHKSNNEARTTNTIIFKTFEAPQLVTTYYIYTVYKKKKKTLLTLEGEQRFCPCSCVPGDWWT